MPQLHVEGGRPEEERLVRGKRRRGRGDWGGGGRQDEERLVRMG